ncbi:MAG: hypothetical protein H6625_12400 [Bdellovibrionaceae bacterium]|nr:hypothetical protein [Pseudobdellovibrionaceae bacterium]
MELLKKVASVVTALSLVTSSLAFAQAQNQTQRATDLITGEILRSKDQGAKIEDERGNEISAAQIISGQATTVVYTPADGKGLKYMYRANHQNQSVALAVLKADGTRVAARSFSVDTNLSPEQNVLRMRQTMNSLSAEVDRALASNPVKSTGCFPTSVDPFIMLQAMFLGLNTFYCFRDPKKYAFSCGFAVFIGAMFLIDVAG